MSINSIVTFLSLRCLQFWFILPYSSPPPPLEKKEWVGLTNLQQDFIFLFFQEGKGSSVFSDYFLFLHRFSAHRFWKRLVMGGCFNSRIQMVSVNMKKILTCLFFSYYLRQHKGQRISTAIGNSQSLSQQDCLGRGKVMVMGFDKEFLRGSLFFQKSGFSFLLVSLFEENLVQEVCPKRVAIIHPSS